MPLNRCMSTEGYFRLRVTCSGTERQRLTLSGIPGIGQWRREFSPGDVLDWTNVTPQPAAPKDPWSEPQKVFEMVITVESESKSPFGQVDWKENRYDACCRTTFSDGDSEVIIHTASPVAKPRDEEKWRDLVITLQEGPLSEDC